MAWARFLRGDAGGWAATGIDLLFPPECPLCHREPAARPGGGHEPAKMRFPVCPPCAHELSADIVRCDRCGSGHGGSGPCRHRPHVRRDWDRVVVLGAYAAGLREAVLRAKRPGGGRVVSALAALLVRKHGETLRAAGIDCVAPVPMHWWRRTLRGASAADDLADGVAALLGLPSSRPLLRTRPTRMQNELPVEDRPRNVATAFRVRRPLRGCSILLVDDVMTTGATVAACARALKAAGARGVSVAVVARADSQRSLDDHD